MNEDNVNVNENVDLNTEDNNDDGNVSISSDVVAVIASLAASSVEGVAGMVNSLKGGFSEFLGKKNLSKGVKVSIEDRNVTVDLFITVEYGAKIPSVAWEIQEKVKSELETMTGLNVVAVNISVEGIKVPQDTDEAEVVDAEVEVAAEETAEITEESDE